MPPSTTNTPSLNDPQNGRAQELLNKKVLIVGAGVIGSFNALGAA